MKLLLEEATASISEKQFVLHTEVGLGFLTPREKC